LLINLIIFSIGQSVNRLIGQSVVRPSKVVSYNGWESRLVRFNQPPVVSFGG